MLYEAHRDTFLFSPDPYRRTALESCRDEFHRFQLFRASIYIYIYMWMEKGSNDGIFFIHACSSLLPIRRDFPPRTDRATGFYTWREYDGNASRCWSVSKENARSKELGRGGGGYTFVNKRWEHGSRRTDVDGSREEPRYTDLIGKVMTRDFISLFFSSPSTEKRNNRGNTREHLIAIARTNVKKKEGKKSTLHWHTVSQQHEKTLLINYLAWGLRKSMEIPIFERVQHCLRRRVVSSSCEDMFSSTSLSPLLVFLSHFLRILEKKNDARIQPIIFFFFLLLREIERSVVPFSSSILPLSSPL